MKVAVTGGAGLVGRFLVEHAIAAGDDVTLLSRHEPPTGFFSKTVTHRPFALGDAPDLTGYDAVFHCAFSHIPGRYRGGEGDDPDGFIRANLDGSIKLFQSAKGSGVPRLVFLSSRAVYGAYPDGTPLTEDLPPKPVTLYGEVKWQAEKALADMASPDFAPICLRATGVYGPAGPGQMHKWANLFADFAAARPISPRVGTELHGDDLATAANLSLNAAPGTYNVSDLLLDRRDLLEMVAQETGVQAPLPARSETPVSVMQTERLRALGWSPGGLEKLQKTLPKMLG
ncbi:NAD-dependent epimerase/dehydratase family protein [Actibacterium lipolyticum]|uniref:UDP-glucose 4-epimerase n=1 Tax=Actibacterium lipolyticum TaxID=1524263 RepID=A0A238JXL3_9RHOB|nr:NAD(P)-dependent oxidoreductase [Actibacterium lipolyticum]SMX34884.1 UDP-glucose 4-epimerase [Actibacterium lipolyticum]